MAGDCRAFRWRLCACICLAACLACIGTAWAQGPGPDIGPYQNSPGQRLFPALGGNGRRPTGPVAADSVEAPANEELPVPGVEELPPLESDAPGETVLDVRVVSPNGISEERTRRIARVIHTRKTRPFSKQQVEEDKRRLMQTNDYVDVTPSYERLPEGVVVYFNVLERPRWKAVRYVGDVDGMKRTLAKKSGIKKGDPADPYSADDARRKLEEYFREKGFSRATVKLIEGDEPADDEVIFLIHKGVRQRVFRVVFEGNDESVAPDGRLRTIVESKRPFLFLFKGEVNRHKIDEDVDRLIDYYKGLGYFNVFVGRELDFNESKSWLTLRFVINEGPRYRVRNVVFSGPSKYTDEQLGDGLKLQDGEFFNRAHLQADRTRIEDKYGAIGHVFARIQPEPVFQEEPGTLDLVYTIDEGRRYRVGRVNVTIRGEHPHTRRNTVLNRLSIRPGDIADTREFRDSERRLKFSGLFMNDPAQGIEPRLVFEPANGNSGRAVAERPEGPDNFRGQSPDGESEGFLDLRFSGELADDAPLQDEPLDPSFPARLLEYVDEEGGGAPAARDRSGSASRPRRETSLRFQSPDEEDADEPPARDDNRLGQVRRGRTGPDDGFEPRRPSRRYPLEPVARTARVGSRRRPPIAPARDFPARFQDPAGEMPPPGPGYDPQTLVPEDENSPYLNSSDPNVDIGANVSEAQTGRLMVGVNYNSNGGLFGNITLDEQNFDWRRAPRSWEDIRNGSAFRGGGQQFRLEAMPGNLFQRYVFQYRQPYLFDTPINFGISGYYFTRRYFDWTEQRLGGRVSLGYQFPDNPDLSISTFLRGEDVGISNVRTPTPESLQRVVGHNGLYTAGVNLAHDTRDSAFLPTEGHLLNLGFEQGFGEFDFPRVTVSGRQYFLLRERPDGSGRHVIGLGSDFGYTGSGTPIFENFFAGGQNSLRGFYFRSASPQEMGVQVGGRFQLLNFVEYMFPITADDAIRGVLFCDFGTVERTMKLEGQNFRVSPGFGLRISIPAFGPAPIALDFAVPVAHADGDRIQNFTFGIGIVR